MWYFADCQLYTALRTMAAREGKTVQQFLPIYLRRKVFGEAKVQSRKVTHGK